MDYQPMMFFFDTKHQMSHTTSSLQKEMTHGNRKNRFCSTHGVSAEVRFSTVCPTLQRAIQNQELLLLGPIPLYGLRAAKPIAFRAKEISRQRQETYFKPKTKDENEE
jgi:hypothetical protein